MKITIMVPGSRGEVQPYQSMTRKCEDEQQPSVRVLGLKTEWVELLNLYKNIFFAIVAKL